jgi:3-oxoadipate enol-lactonase
MAFVALQGTVLHYRYQSGQGRPVVFLNSLGTDFRIWDAVAAGSDAPVLCMDKRGHGLSDDAPVSMDSLVQDVAALMDHLGLGPAVICGVSVGGMIAQGLAVARPDLVSGLVLCCTGAKIGDAESWNARIAAVQRDGLAAMADAVLERWFSPGFHERCAPELSGYRNMLTRTLPAGYTAVCAAIRDTDHSLKLAQITAPTLCIAGADDKATPPELVENLARLIPGAAFQLLENCGHLPCVEAPAAVARAVQQLRAMSQ